MKKRWWTRLVTLLLLGTLGMLPGGCFGRFQLSRAVWALNSVVPTRLLRTIVCWIFIVIPVYLIAGLVDFFVINVLEFWLDFNPLAPGSETRSFRKGDTEVVMTLERDGDILSATLVRHEQGRLHFTLRLRDEGRGTVSAVWEAEGREARYTEARVLEDGTVELAETTAAGVKRQRRKLAEVEELAGRVESLARKVQPRECPEALVSR